MKELKYATNILHLTLTGSQFMKNIDINIYYGGPFVNLKRLTDSHLNGWVSSALISWYVVEWFEDENNGRIEFEPYLLWHKDYLSLPTRSPLWTDKLGYMAIKEDKHVKIMFNRIHKMSQVNAAELYVSSEPLAEVDTEEV